MIKHFNIKDYIIGSYYNLHKIKNYSSILNYRVVFYIDYKFYQSEQLVIASDMVYNIDDNITAYLVEKMEHFTIKDLILMTDSDIVKASAQISEIKNLRRDMKINSILGNI